MLIINVELTVIKNVKYSKIVLLQLSSAETSSVDANELWHEKDFGIPNKQKNGFCWCTYTLYVSSVWEIYQYLKFMRHSNLGGPNLTVHVA